MVTSKHGKAQKTKTPRPLPGTKHKAESQRKRGGKQRGGMPPYVPTERDTAYVRAMLLQRLPEHEIAEVLGIHERTLRKHYADDLKNGLKKANAMVIANYWRQITKDDFRSMSGAQYYMDRRIPNWTPPSMPSDSGNPTNTGVLKVVVMNAPEQGLDHLRTSAPTVEVSGHEPRQSDPFEAMNDPDKPSDETIRARVRDITKPK